MSEGGKKSAVGSQESEKNKSDPDSSRDEHPKRRSPLEHLKETINGEKFEINKWKYTTTPK
jgi:hypothetical protein